MRFTTATPDMPALTALMEEDIAVAVTSAMGDATDLTKQDYRDTIEGAGLGARLGKTVRSRVYPTGAASLDPAGLIFSKAPKIIYAFASGLVIKARGGRWMALPTPAAGPKRITPKAWERRNGIKLRFVLLRGGRSAILVADGARVSSRGYARPLSRGRNKTGPYSSLKGRATVIVFQLTRGVRDPKLLDVKVLADRGAARVPGLIDVRLGKTPDRDAPMTAVR